MFMLDFGGVVEKNNPEILKREIQMILEHGKGEIYTENTDQMLV